MDELKRLLNHGREGGAKLTADELLPLVYQKLRQVAAEKMQQEAGGHTLQATALVHEAWLRVGGGAQDWQNRWHFFSAAAEAMGHILIDKARRKKALRHGGVLQKVPMDEGEIVAPVPDDELLEVHEALGQLAKLHPRKAELVKLRYFVGLTIPEVAEVLGISVSTAERDWTFSRVWLYREIARTRSCSAVGLPGAGVNNPPACPSTDT